MLESLLRTVSNRRLPRYIVLMLAALASLLVIESGDAAENRTVNDNGFAGSASGEFGLLPKEDEKSLLKLVRASKAQDEYCIIARAKLAELYTKAGDIAKAETYYRSACADARGADIPEGTIINVLYSAAMFNLYRGDYAAAKALLQEGIQVHNSGLISPREFNPYEVSPSISLLAEILMFENRRHDALSAYETEYQFLRQKVRTGYHFGMFLESYESFLRASGDLSRAKLIEAEIQSASKSRIQRSSKSGISQKGPLDLADFKQEIREYFFPDPRFGFQLSPLVFPPSPQCGNEPKRYRRSRQPRL